MAVISQVDSLTYSHLISLPRGVNLMCVSLRICMLTFTMDVCQGNLQRASPAGKKISELTFISVSQSFFTYCLKC